MATLIGPDKDDVDNSAQIEELQGEVERLTLENQQNVARVQQLEAEANAHASQLSGLQTQIQQKGQLQGEVERLKLENQKNVARVQQLEAEAQAHASQLSGLQAQIQQKDQMLANMQKQGAATGEQKSHSSKGTVHHTINADEQLVQGAQLYSPNFQYRAVVQDDGHFCVYQNQGGNWSYIWGTGVHGTGNHPWRVVMQGDNNIAMYDRNGTCVWHAGCNGGATGPNARLSMQDDGNLCVYDHNNQFRWGSKN